MAAITGHPDLPLHNSSLALQLLKVLASGISAESLSGNCSALSKFTAPPQGQRTSRGWHCGCLKPEQTLQDRSHPRAPAGPSCSLFGGRVAILPLSIPPSFILHRCGSPEPSPATLMPTKLYPRGGFLGNPT